MTAKPVIPREQAVRDVEGIIDGYAREAGERVALGFIEALEQAYRFIGDHPAAGSPRYAHELGFPGLRNWLLKKFPYVIFYVEQEDRVDVWRLLHGRRDIPATLADPDVE